MNKALIAVDVQKDFLPGGTLAVPEGDKIVGSLIHLSSYCDLVIATRDWHPIDHSSFESQGGPWPEHCVQDQPGAKIELPLKPDLIVDKGTEPDDEGYSAVAGTQLADWLKEKEIDLAVVGGLALDYCVKATAIDLVDEGFNVDLWLPATKPVSKETGYDALVEMADVGVRLV